MAIIGTNQAKIMTKLDAHHERMDSQLERMEACLENMETTEEIGSESEHQKVPKEEAAVEMIGALKEQ
jgi:hypothetical protein